MYLRASTKLMNGGSSFIIHWRKILIIAKIAIRVIKEDNELKI